MAKYQIDNIPSPLAFQEDDVVKRTLQNAKNLLMCRMGEVPYDRLRGFDPDLLDLPIDEMEEELIPELDRLMMWEPDVEVEDAEASLLRDGSTYVKVILDVTIPEAGADDDEDEEEEEE